MSFTKLTRTSLTTLATLCALFAGSVSAQDYPTRPVRLVVPYVPGGSTDIIGRIMAQQLTDIWGQSVLVDNRGGGATIIGTDIVAKGTPDGHVLAISTAALGINPSLFAGKLPYDTMKDFVHIMLINTSPFVLVVPPSLPARNVQELIALAKSKNGAMNYGSSGVGGAGHLSGELLNLLAGVKTQHVPYKGNAPALTDLVAGRVDFVFNGTTSVLGLIQAGKLRALAVSSLKRVSALPDVPTLDEAGLKGYSSVAWNGISAPAKTPAAIVRKINADANKALAHQSVQDRLKNDGSESAGGTPAQFQKFIQDELSKWTKVIKAGNIKPE
jgi:tripartite-type tricarboxylate transporter receptor subunit TctC